MRLPTCILFAATSVGGGLFAGCADQAFTTVSGNDASAGDAVTDAGARGFCEGLTPAPTFCADFDDGEQAPAGWSSSNTLPAGSGTLTVDTAESKSAPGSLLVRSTSDGGFSIATLARYITPPIRAEAVTLEYDLFIEDIASAFDVKIASVHFTAPSLPGDYAIFFSAKSTGAALLERMPSVDGGTGPFTVTPATLFPLPRRWTHVALAFDFRKAEATLKVDLDGQTAVAERPLTKGFYRGLAAVAVGMPFAEVVNGTIALRIDNVVLRVE